MGVSMFDKEKSRRMLDDEYRLTLNDDVERWIGDSDKLMERVIYQGNLTVVDTELDFQEAVRLAELTTIEQETLECVVFHAMTLDEASKELGRDLSTISRNKKRALTKISNVFKSWGYYQLDEDTGGADHVSI